MCSVARHRSSWAAGLSAGARIRKFGHELLFYDAVARIAEFYAVDQQQGVSVNSAAGKSVNDLSQGLPHTKVGVTTFAPSDPVVYYFVDGPAKASAVMAAYWDRERKEWFVAASLERSQGPETFEKMRRTIHSVACSTLD